MVERYLALDCFGLSRGYGEPGQEVGGAARHPVTSRNEYGLYEPFRECSEIHVRSDSRSDDPGVEIPIKVECPEVISPDEELLVAVMSDSSEAVSAVGRPVMDFEDFQAAVEECCRDEEHDSIDDLVIDVEEPVERQVEQDLFDELFSDLDLPEVKVHVRKEIAEVTSDSHDLQVRPGLAKEEPEAAPEDPWKGVPLQPAEDNLPVLYLGDGRMYEAPPAGDDAPIELALPPRQESEVKPLRRIYNRPDEPVAQMLSTILMRKGYYIADSKGNSVSRGNISGFYIMKDDGPKGMFRRKKEQGVRVARLNLSSQNWSVHVYRQRDLETINTLMNATAKLYTARVDVRLVTRF